MKQDDNNEYKIEMFKKLQGTNIILGLPPKEQRQLEEYEKFIFKKVDDRLNDEFDRIWNEKFYYESIKEIEGSIQNLMNNYFTFDELLETVAKSDHIEIKELIVKFYNFISNIGIIPINVASQLFYVIDEYILVDDEDNTYAETVSDVLGQCVSFSGDWAKSSFQIEEYMSGNSGTSHFFTTFVHEFGHAIANFAALSSEWRSIFNMFPTNKEELRNMSCDEYIDATKGLTNTSNARNYRPIWKKTYSDIMTKFYDFIYKKSNSWFKNIFSSNYNYKYFTWWITIPSFYGWSSEAEGFAEAFAYYILTPRDLRNVPWGWLHEYFTKIFPKLYFN